MVTKGKTVNLKPKTFLTHTEPTIVKHALDQPHWFGAMQLEYNSLLTKNTWTLISLLSHRKAIAASGYLELKEILMARDQWFLHVYLASILLSLNYLV